MKTNRKTLATVHIAACAAVICTGLFFQLSELCRAQVAAAVLNGTVTDASGALVPKAKITITSLSTGSSRTVETGSAGAYTIPDLAPGVYSISVEASGFKKIFVPRITLYVGQTSTQNFHLQLGNFKQEVSIRAQQPLLDTTNGQLGTVITGTLMTQLPLNGRNFMQLNLLSPGAITDKTGNTSKQVSLNPNDITFSINGQMSDYNMYLLDGLEIKDWQHGTQVFSPSVDAVREFQTTQVTIPRRLARRLVPRLTWL